MGVPKFYRWVTSRYPVVESEVLSSSQDSNLQIDNLYLDMNGIIHQCSHSNNNVLQLAFSYDTIVAEICKYLDNVVVNIVRPLQILFIAVDGVAPRAKLNQQRSRRFRSAYDMKHSLEKLPSSASIDVNQLFDSNCITPGTEFMVSLSASLKQFVVRRMQENAVWNRLQVYFSGSEVPGEGEHKLISFIRERMESPDYKPNQRHVMNGQDADMIMLALATHELYFYILREVQNIGVDTSRKSYRGKNKSKKNKNLPPVACAVKFQYFRINILRECLVNELTDELDVDTMFNFERLIDDFVFLTFLVGNDFLPNIPCLCIGDGAFDIMFTAYKDLLHNSLGYITKDGVIDDIERLQEFLSLLSLSEQSIMMDRFNSKTKPNTLNSVDSNIIVDYRQHYYSKKFGLEVELSPLSAALSSIKLNDGVSEPCFHYVCGLAWCLSYYSRGCVSWKWFYPHHYSPLLIDLSNSLKDCVEKAYSLLYSQLGTPFNPFQQLLGCLPPSSAHLLPRCYQQLMLSPDSPIYQYYPSTIILDMDGKDKAWEAVVVLPFIDEACLLQAEAAYCPLSQLSEDEKFRNTFGNTILYSVARSTLVSASVDVSQQVLPLNIRPSKHSFPAQLREGTSQSMPGFASLKDIYAARSAIPRRFPNNCIIRLRFNPTYETLLVALAVNVSTAYPAFTPLFHQPESDYTGPNAKLAPTRPFSVALCSSLNAISNSVTVADVMQVILPSAAANFGPVRVRLSGNIVDKKNKSYLMLSLEDVDRDVCLLGQFIAKHLPGCNSWYVDEPNRLSLILGTFHTRDLPPISVSGISADSVAKADLEVIVKDELKKLSATGFLDLICEEVEVSEELTCYPRTPLRLVGELSLG